MQLASRPILIIIRGVPGSGKSVVAIALQQALGSKRVVLLDPDAIDYTSSAYASHVKSCIAEGVDPALYAYRYLRAQAYDAIAAHEIIIWNQPFTNLEIFNKMVGRLRDKAAECQTQLQMLLIEVDIDPLVAKRRVEERMQTGGHGPSDSTLQKRFDEYETFAGTGYQVVSVQGEDPVALSVEKIKQALDKLRV